MLRRNFLAVAAAMALTVPVLAQTNQPINFGIISTESSANLKSGWQPVLDDMAEELGVQINPFFASDYAGIVEAMRFNKVQLAWYGNQSAIEAVDRANAEVFASVVSAAGEPGYWSILIAHKDSALHSVEDVLANSKDLAFGAGDPNSTSGTAVPGFYLWAQNGVDPRQIFKTSRASNHEANLMSVINKHVDIATISSEALERYTSSTGKDANESIRVIWTSPLISADPLVWRKDLSEDLKSGVREFFLNYGQQGPEAEQQRANLEALGYSKFNASDDNQLIPIRQLGLAKRKAEIEGDSAQSAEDKRTALAEIDSQLEALDAALKAAAE